MMGPVYLAFGGVMFLALVASIIHLTVTNRERREREAGKTENQPGH